MPRIYAAINKFYADFSRRFCEYKGAFVKNARLRLNGAKMCVQRRKQLSFILIERYN